MISLYLGRNVSKDANHGVPMNHQTSPFTKAEVLPILSESFNLYRDNFQLFFKISLVGYSVFLLEQFLTIHGINLGIFGLATFIAGYFLLFWSLAALIRVIADRYQNIEIEFFQAFQSTQDKIWRLIGISILQSLIVIVGLLLLIIPGVYWATILALASVVLVLENKNLFECLKRSKDLIHINFWPILFLLLTLFLINSFASIFFYSSPLNLPTKVILVYLLSIFLAPWMGGVSVILYLRLRKTMPETGPSSDPESFKGSGWLGCLGMMVLTIAMILLSVFWLINLNHFIRTEKGRRTYTWTAKRVSPPITFPDGTKFQRPKGYLVLAPQNNKTTYGLFGFVEDKFYVFHTYYLSFIQLGITDINSVTFGDGTLWESYYDYLTEQTPQLATHFKFLEQNSLQVITIGDRLWSECIWEQKKTVKGSKATYWVCYYTLSDQGVIFVNFQYQGSGPLFEQGESSSEIKAARNILAQFTSL